ncbi:MAG TPA: Hsp20/alpha crystallin family protein [Polyangiales bacterium]|nr:Hsp20/alpha crystallin family protein [Polyangiales bacterium]
MAITRWNPFRELEEMNDRLNRAFGRSQLARELDAQGKDALVGFDWAPTVDITENNEEFQIKAELPEVKKEDVKIHVEDGVLTLSGERKQEKEEQNKKWHRVERSYGSFMRSFTLPANIDDAKIRAEFKDGVLTMRLPKSATAKPKSIEVKLT